MFSLLNLPRHSHVLLLRDVNRYLYGAHVVGEGRGEVDAPNEDVP